MESGSSTFGGVQVVRYVGAIPVDEKISDGFDTEVSLNSI